MTLGMAIAIFSYQNFEYPQEISKAKTDLTSSLNSSDLDIQRTRRSLGRSVPAATQAVQAQIQDQPLKLKLKRAPAKSNSLKKKKKKKKNSRH